MTVLQKKKLVVPSFFQVAVLVALIRIAVYRQNERNSGSQQWVRHTGEVKRTLAETLSLMKALESGVRAHLFTGWDSCLKPSYRAKAQAKQKILILPIALAHGSLWPSSSGREAVS